MWEDNVNMVEASWGDWSFQYLFGAYFQNMWNMSVKYDVLKQYLGEMGGMWNKELNGTWNIYWDIYYIHEFIFVSTNYGSSDPAVLLFANYLYSAVSEVLQRAVTYCPHAEILWLMAPWNVWAVSEIKIQSVMVSQMYIYFRVQALKQCILMHFVDSVHLFIWQNL